jgi:hypothetical protein
MDPDIALSTVKKLFGRSVGRRAARIRCPLTPLVLFPINKLARRRRL